MNVFLPLESRLCFGLVDKVLEVMLSLGLKTFFMLLFSLMSEPVPDCWLAVAPFALSVRRSSDMGKGPS